MRPSVLEAKPTGAASIARRLSEKANQRCLVVVLDTLATLGIRGECWGQGERTPRRRLVRVEGEATCHVHARVTRRLFGPLARKKGLGWERRQP